MAKGAPKIVRDVMHRGVVTVDLDTTIRDVVKTMVDNRVHTVVVVDEGAQACGVITKVDVLKHYGKDPDKLTSEEIMTPKIISVSAEALVSEAVGMMQVRKVHQLIIVKDEAAQRRRPIGIISVSDVVGDMVK